MYDLKSYGRMMADRVRMDAYVTALRQVVRPDSVVLEIGTGAGVFALLACRFGARRVYAVEPSDAIEVARAAARANGFADRIEFIHDLSTNITLPERADVILSDLRGALPYFQNNIASIVDARERHLAPGGVLIPQRDCVRLAVVTAPELYETYVGPWETHGLDFDWSLARQKVMNTWGRGKIELDQLLLPEQCVTTLDYTRVTETNFNAEVDWKVEKAGTAHGLLAWFDTTLIEGVGFSSGPGQPDPPVYGNAFFPWSQPVSIAAGDSVSVKLKANMVGVDYIWGWETLVLDQGRSDQVKASFKQSTFFGMTLSPASLRKREAGYIPSLNKDGQVKQFILARMTGDTSLSEIALQLLNQYPSRFATHEAALTAVRELSQKYSR